MGHLAKLDPSENMLVFGPKDETIKQNQARQSNKGVLHCLERLWLVCWCPWRRAIELILD